MKIITYQASFNVDAKYNVWKNAGWEVQPPPPPEPAPSAGKTRASALKGKSGFFAFPNLQPMGWEVQPLPPPHPKPEKAGSIQVGDPGNQDILRNFNPQGWEIQPSLLPHPRTEKSASYLRGDDGISLTYIKWLLSGWEIQPPHFQHPRPEKSASHLRGDDGNQFTYTNWLLSGWETQPPHLLHPRPEKSAWLIGEDGIEAPFIPPVATTVRDFGFSNAFNLKIPTAQRGTALKGKSGFFAFPDLLKFGWEIQSVQPNHLRTEKAGSIQVGSGGVDAPYVFVPPPQAVDFGFSINVPLKLMSLVQRGPGAAGRSEFASFSWTSWGFDDTQFQPLHPHFEKAGTFVIGSGGIESPFTPPLPPPPVGYEMIPITWPLRTWQRGAGLKGKSGFFAFPDLLKFGWEIQPPQPNHPRVERVGAILIGDSGTQAVYVFVPITPLLPQGWEIQSFQPNHPRTEKAAAWMIGDDGTEAPFVPPTPPPPVTEHHDMPFFASMGQLKSW